MHDNDKWLSSTIDFSSFTNIAVKESQPRGRPAISFDDCSQRSKERKAKKITENIDSSQLLLATEMQMRSSGKRSSAGIVKELAFASPERGNTIKKLRTSSNKIEALSPDEALAMILDLDLSANKYRLLKQYTKHICPNLFPSYERVFAAKQLCYPENITVTESFAEINLQSLIDHTIIRLCASINDVLKANLDSCNGNELQILFKWGCDGANQSPYKQNWSDERNSDENLFSISLVPIQMYVNNFKGEKLILYQNPAPNSSRHCRPIKIMFAKETTDLIKMEVKYIKEQIAELRPTKVNVLVDEVHRPSIYVHPK